ncbi:hypothetical protein WJX77_012156 [Trebouxia sp. C0004]
MSSNSKTSVSKAQNEQHKKILSQLLKLECNRRCCDCSARGPTWASVNLGLFVCLNCSGIHRSLGTHLSKVRSTTLDTWLPEQVEFISKLGNVRANNYWEARLPRGFRRPSEGDMSAMKNFIIEKYQNQAYASSDFDSPPNIDNYFNHPFMQQADAPAAVAPLAADTQASDKASVSSDGPSSPVRQSNGTTLPSSRPARVSFKGITAPAPAAPAATGAAASELIDLLSLEDTTPPVAPVAEQPVTDSDGDWAAFMQASVVQPEAPATAALSHDSSWNAFQSSDAAALDSIPSSTAAPFDPFGGSQTIEAASAGQKATGVGGSASASAAGSGTKHAPNRSADDIMKMFDKPQQNTFAQFTAQGMNGVQQPQTGTFAMQQGGMYGMTPQQLMQAQQLYAAQQMQMGGGQHATYGAFQMPPQATSPWTQQPTPSYAPSLQQMQQHQFSSLAGSSGFP